MLCVPQQGFDKTLKGGPGAATHTHLSSRDLGVQAGISGAQVMLDNMLNFRSTKATYDHLNNNKNQGNSMDALARA